MDFVFNSTASRIHSVFSSPMATATIAKSQPAPLRSARCSAADASNQPSNRRGGEIRRLVLSNEGRTKLNPSPDRGFYDYPRYVKHVDDGFCAALTQLYRERIRTGSAVLDLMSSWVSHLPPEATYKSVVGHGLNAQELLRNDRLDSFFVKDLNDDPSLPESMTESFDAVVCTVSVQYLQQPEKVFAEIWRVLRPGGVCIVSFSNRMFYEKAVAAWRDGTAYSRSRLVTEYFQSVAGFTQPQVVRSPVSAAVAAAPANPVEYFLRLLQPLQSDPFYAVVAYKGFKPIYD